MPLLNETLSISLNDCFMGIINDHDWYKLFRRDFKSKAWRDLASKKPAAVPWLSFYIACVDWPSDPVESNQDVASSLSLSGAVRQLRQSKRRSAPLPPAPSLTELLQFLGQIRAEHLKLAADSLSTVQQLVLEGDVETAAYQIDRQLSRYESRYTLKEEKSLLHFTALSRSPSLLQYLINQIMSSSKSEEATQLLNQKDVVSGQSALHLALICGAPHCFLQLLLAGAHIDAKDKLFATAIDYARLLGLLDNLEGESDEASGENFCCLFLDEKRDRVRRLSHNEYRQLFPQVRSYCSGTIGSLEYIMELFFSGVQVDRKEDEFRQQVLKRLPKSQSSLAHSSASDRRRLILAHSGLNDVGYGLYALDSFGVGEVVTLYGGQLRAADALSDRSYAVASAIDGVLIDAKNYRSLAGFANHSSADLANAELRGTLEAGAERVALVAIKAIERGQPILFNYDDDFFDLEDDGAAEEGAEEGRSGLRRSQVVIIDPNDEKFQLPLGILDVET